MNRDLDATIAEIIFNWKPIPVGPDYHGLKSDPILCDPNINQSQDLYNRLPRTGKIHKGYLCPNYSSDLAQALKLAIHVGLTTPIKDIPTSPELIAQLSLNHFLSLHTANITVPQPANDR